MQVCYIKKNNLTEFLSFLFYWFLSVINKYYQVLCFNGSDREPVRDPGGGDQEEP